MLREEFQSTRDSASVWVKSELHFTWECDDPGHKQTMDEVVGTAPVFLCIVGPNVGKFRRNLSPYRASYNPGHLVDLKEFLDDAMLSRMHSDGGHGLIRPDGVRRCYVCEHIRERQA